MLVALYLRRSTDEKHQADSIEAQNVLLREWCRTKGHSVWGEPLVDNASGRTAERSSFQHLIALVSAGAPFEAVLVRDVTRWGRFLNIDEAAFWEFYFLSHGVRVLYAQEAFRDDEDPFAAIQKTLRRFAAAELSREKGRLLQYGKFRVVQAGFWKGGRVPFGFVRVLVRREDGNVLRELAEGDRKAICAERVSLRPAKDGTAEVVRRIFKLYVEKRRSPFRIGSRLNREGISSPAGGRWTLGTVVRILKNPAYAGIAAARFERSENFLEPVNVETPNAWPSIVSASLWKRAQTILTEHRACQASSAKNERLRVFFQEHSEFTVRYRYGRAAEWVMPGGISTASTDRAAGAILGTIEAAKRDLASEFAIESDGPTVLLDGVLRVGFAASLPRGHELGGVQWRFDFDGTETQDITIAIGLGADLRPAAFFMYVNMRWKRKARRMSPRLAPGAYATILPRKWPDLVNALRHDKFRYSTATRAQFLEAIDGARVVNTYKVSRVLGWNLETARVMYHRLRREGVSLPPLSKAVGRRLTLVCDDCGKQRTWSWSNAMQFKTSLCRTCFNRRRAKREYCSVCGVRRSIDRRPVPDVSNDKTLPARRLKKCATCQGRLSLKRAEPRKRDRLGRFMSERKAPRSARRSSVR